MTNQYSYELSLNILRALGGDMTVQYENTDQIWAAIDGIYAVSGDGLDLQSLVLNITENGTYDYNITDKVDAYVPVNISVNVPQKYTDEQVEDLKDTAREEGYTSGYDKGIADGYVQGESEGYTDGYAEGLEDGAEDQKALLEEITIRDNGVYEKEDGYKKVTVEVPIPEIPTFETEELSVELTTNGTYNYTPTTDGYSKVSVTVDVDTSGGGGKPKIYNSFVINANGAYAETLSNIDFSLYDWSGVYDLTEFFAGYKSSYAGSTWSASYFNNFIQNYNGKIVRGYKMFKYPSGSASYAALGEIPDFSKFSSDMVSLDGMFYECTNLTKADNLAKWDTSNVIDAKEMFYNCKKLPSIPLFNTSNVCNMEYMFYNCQKLTTIPLFDTSNVTNMSYMFQSCYALTSVPQFDTSNVTITNFMFSGCEALTSVPQFDTSNVTNMNSMFNKCPNLTSLPEFNCGSITSNYIDIFSNTSMQYLTDLGGFKDLGKVSNFSNPSCFLKNCPYLTKDSVMNVINKLYDRAAAGYTTRKLIFSANALSQLSDEEKAIATNKGWTLATS